MPCYRANFFSSNHAYKILSPDYFEGHLTEGMNFEFREGSRIIGKGEIKCIINDKLEIVSH